MRVCPGGAKILLSSFHMQTGVQWLPFHHSISKRDQEDMSDLKALLCAQTVLLRIWNVIPFVLEVEDGKRGSCSSLWENDQGKIRHECHVFISG